ncbi:MAG: hypothetical protein M3362_00225 [Acidobacteriota bacterium]|nr:hypothetical protein [Acidobacteriota bacterium]
MDDSPIAPELPNSPPVTEGKWYAPFRRTKGALIELLAHGLVVAGLLFAIRLLEELVHYLWRQTDYLFFGKIPLKYIFDAADLAILIGFLTYGVYSVVRAYVREA